MVNREQFLAELDSILEMEYQTTLEQADAGQLHYAVGKWAQGRLYPQWSESRLRQNRAKRAYYFSAEFLMGRMVFSNLYNMGVLDQVRAILRERGVDLALLEEVEDAALGNGGLGRLAACYLDSAATHDLPLDGYGIRYRYGLFRQSIVEGAQRESADDWQRFGDPWSIRREAEAVRVRFGDQEVNAVPYDMAVVGYGTATVNTLRLWQSEPVEAFDFTLFNAQKYDQAVQQRNDAETISMVLYPNDDTPKGKALRLKQEYFFSSASLQDILRRYKASHGRDFSHFAEQNAIQLNDTHPVVAIPELIRLLMDQEGLEFLPALEIARDTFSYTNHTVMPEAMEKWSVQLMGAVIPRVLQIVRMINEHLIRELSGRGLKRGQIQPYRIVAGGMVHMARLAVYASHHTNGVARIHTEILKSSVLKEWYALYPERFSNKTNGITQRRWMGLCNPELSRLLTELLGTDAWLTDLNLLSGLSAFADDRGVLDRLLAIKAHNKRRLCDYVSVHEKFQLNPDFLFDVQVKRLHEYKRQLLNAFSILDLYFGLKEGRVTDFHPTAFLFGAKAAPGYYRAKGIIKFIGEIAKKIDGDPEVNGRLAVLFVQNYNVSYAELLMPAAEVSEQISTAGTEASGTGNMKLALNGAVTLGTYDGANIEIVEQAGEENNYIFGLRVEDVRAMREDYDPQKLYDGNPRIRRVVDTLVDGTFDDGGTGAFQELYDSLLIGASWHRPDQYFLLADLEAYVDAKLRANRDYQDCHAFARKCLLNIAGCGRFSSDRSVREYADEIWRIRPSK